MTREEEKVSEDVNLSSSSNRVILEGSDAVRSSNNAKSLFMEAPQKTTSGQDVSLSNKQTTSISEASPDPVQSSTFKMMPHQIKSSTPIQQDFNTPSNSENNEPQEDLVGNVVTVIEVQSGSVTVAASTSDGGAKPVDTNREGVSEGAVSVTRINVTSGESSQVTRTEESHSVPIVKGLDDKEEAGRGTLRLGHGSRHPSENFDDNASDISSVVNNPSVISQLPDRYGFLGGEQYTHESEPEPSPEIARRREMKWLMMLDKWDHFMRKDFKTVKSRCRKGIPRSIRGRAWFYLCGASHLKNKNPEVFSQLCQREGKPECIEDIKKDLHRQFPWHEIFAEEGHGQKDLYNVLKAYSILNAKDGYCQAQAPIAAILLMHMPSEDAFWCLVAICEKYLKGYYSPGMQQLQLDGDILFGLLKRVAPPVYKHLKKQKIDPVLYMTEWFLCAFTRTLPWTSVLRVWDSFLCEGVKVLFRVGLVLLKYTLGRTGVLKLCPNMYETLMQLKNLPNYVTHEQFLVAQVQRLDISDEQMRREHYKQITKRKKAQQKAEKNQKKSTSVSGVNKIIDTSVQRSHETAL